METPVIINVLLFEAIPSLLPGKYHQIKRDTDNYVNFDHNCITVSPLPVGLLHKFK